MFRQMKVAEKTNQPERERYLPNANGRQSAEPAQSLLCLQQAAGNLAMQRLLRERAIQAKLTISQPNDPYEQEAERVAEEVMEMAAESAPAVNALAYMSGQDIVFDMARYSPATPTGSLDERTRALMEDRFGERFDDVRIHTGTRAGKAADSFHSRAFTVGRDMVFAEGEFAPETTKGLRLLAHELAHVVQQRRTVGGLADEKTAECDAHEAAREVASGGTAAVRERTQHGVIQKASLKEIRADYGFGKPWNRGGVTVMDWDIEADGYTVVTAFAVSVDKTLKPRAWENPDTKTLYIDPGTDGSSAVIRKGRWERVIITRGVPSVEWPVPPAPTPKPKPAPAPQKTKPKKEAPTQPRVIPAPEFIIPEIVIGPSEDVGESAQAPPEPDRRPIAEQVITSLEDDPAKVARLAPKLTDTELERLMARDRIDLLNALATNSGVVGLDVRTVLRVLQTTAPSQQLELLEGLVANDGKVLAALRASVLPKDRNSLENSLFQIQLAVNLRTGTIGANPNLLDPLGARGFRRPLWTTSAPSWVRDLQFRVEPNGDWTLQAPGQEPLIIKGPLTRELRAERLNEKTASFEARQLSPQGKVDRIKELVEHKWTGSRDEERIIDILRYTPSDEAALVLNGLKTTQSGGKPLLDKLDSAVQLENNVLFHAELAALRLRARKDDPKLLSDLAKAPVLPWRDSFFDNRAVFSIQTMPDGRIAVTYGALQSFALESSEAFGAAMRALPKEMQHGGTLFLQPDDIVIVNDTDSNRQVPLTAADLIAFQHSGNRGLLKHMGNVASVVVPVGLAARGAISVGRAALEAGVGMLTMGVDEYRMEMTKWSPGLMRAIDIANLVMAIKGGVDLTKLGAAGVRTIHSILKREYDNFKAFNAAKMAASGDAKAIRAAQIADAEAPALMHDLKQIQSGGVSGALEELELEEVIDTGASASGKRKVSILDASDMKDPDVSDILAVVPEAQGNCFRNAVVMGLRFEGFKGARVRDVPHVPGEAKAVGSLFERAWGREARFQKGGLAEAEATLAGERGSQVILRARNKRGALHALLGRVNDEGKFEVWDAKLVPRERNNPLSGYFTVPRPAKIDEFEILGFRKLRFR